MITMLKKALTKDQFAKIAANSGDVAINSVRLSKANAGLNAQLGTGVVLVEIY